MIVNQYENYGDANGFRSPSSLSMAANASVTDYYWGTSTGVADTESDQLYWKILFPIEGEEKEFIAGVGGSCSGNRDSLNGTYYQSARGYIHYADVTGVKKYDMGYGAYSSSSRKYSYYDRSEITRWA